MSMPTPHAGHPGSWKMSLRWEHQKALLLPHWMQESLQLCCWGWGEGTGGQKSSWQRDSLKILLKILQDLKSYS